MKEKKYHFLVDEKSKSIYVEALRKITINLKYLSVDKPYKVIGITSAKPNEGKTFVGINLASIYAEEGKKVIIVDFDLTLPSIHKAFNLHNENGLVEVVSNEVSLDEAIQKTKYNVDVLVRGKAVPLASAFISSESCSNVFEELKKRYDIIIVDTSPTLLLSDALLVSKLCDGMILTINMKETKKSETIDVMHQYKAVNAKVIGAITIRDPLKNNFYYSNYYNTKEAK